MDKNTKGYTNTKNTTGKNIQTHKGKRYTTCKYTKKRYTNNPNKKSIMQFGNFFLSHYFGNHYQVPGKGVIMQRPLTHTKS